MKKISSKIESDQELASDYLVWLVQLTVMTVVGSVATGVLLYFLFPEWIDKVYF